MTPARVLAAAVLALVLLASASVALAAGRVALVVGNSTYAHIARLPNPENDAADMAAALQRLGFEVTTAQDADRASLNEALRGLHPRERGADMALVFYAGHGLEMDGVNYLVPVDARLERDTDVRFEIVGSLTIRPGSPRWGYGVAVLHRHQRRRLPVDAGRAAGTRLRKNLCAVTHRDVRDLLQPWRCMPFLLAMACGEDQGGLSGEGRT